MESPTARAIRLNPGGALSPAEVVGRDPFIAMLWRAIDRQSVLLTAERRMGKTSVLKKMRAEGFPGHSIIMRNLQDVTSPIEFARQLVADLEVARPRLFASRRTIRRALTDAGVRKVSFSPISLELDPVAEGSWKDILRESFAMLDRHPTTKVIFLWDELPHMIDNIAAELGPRAARELLDALRAARERHPRVRMVFSGSLGLHHVLTGLHESGGAWAPVNDMHPMDLPPLTAIDAAFLARELLQNEGLACDDLDGVGRTIAQEVDLVPYYVHLTVQALLERKLGGHAARVVAADVAPIVNARLRDPLDPWQLLHYVHRIKPYYGADEAVVKIVLDIIAISPSPLTFSDLHAAIAAHTVPPSIENVRDLLELLGKDHYVVMDERGLSFRLELLRRAWLVKRHLSP